MAASREEVFERVKEDLTEKLGKDESDIVEEAAPFVLLRLQSDTGAVGVAEITVKPTWCRWNGSLSDGWLELFLAEKSWLRPK